jgi:[ribosomal protein S5]-alanine N-acetyltransferase
VPAIPSPSEPLSDGHLTLRFTLERDIPEMLIAYQDDPLLHVRMSRERPPSGAELGRELEGAERERGEGTRASLTIVEPPAQQCRGAVTVHTINWDQRRAELGVWVALEHRGRGLGRRALRLVTPWLFGTWGLKRLELLTDPDNEPMLRAAHAAGFVREGVLRAYRRAGRGRRDMVVLSLLANDLDPAAAGARQLEEQAR